MYTVLMAKMTPTEKAAMMRRASAAFHYIRDRPMLPIEQRLDLLYQVVWPGRELQRQEREARKEKELSRRARAAALSDPGMVE